MIYQPQNLKTFYNWIAYIIACDVLISMFYYLSLESKEQANYSKQDDSEDDEDTNDSNYEMTFDMNQIGDIIESINPTPTEIETEIETYKEQNDRGNGDISDVKLYPIEELEEESEEDSEEESKTKLEEIEEEEEFEFKLPEAIKLDEPLKKKRVYKKKVLNCNK